MWIITDEGFRRKPKRLNRFSCRLASRRLQPWMISPATQEFTVVVEIFFAYLQAPLHRKILSEKCPSYYTRGLAFGGQFAMDFYYQPVQGDNLSDPKEPVSTTIPRHAITEANKQVQEAVNLKEEGQLQSLWRENQISGYHYNKIHSPLSHVSVFTCHCRTIVFYHTYVMRSWCSTKIFCFGATAACNTVATVCCTAV